jgi:hypothetical protein
LKQIQVAMRYREHDDELPEYRESQFFYFLLHSFLELVPLVLLYVGGMWAVIISVHARRSPVALEQSEFCENFVLYGFGLGV